MKSSSEECVAVTLTANAESVQIRMFDTGSRPVAQGFGRVETSLRPGIYEVHYQLGTSVEQRLVALKPGEPFHDEVSLDIYSAAPFPGTKLFDADHANVVSQLTAPQSVPAGQGELVVFLRTVTRDATLLDDDVLAAIRIVDSSMKEIATLEGSGHGDANRCAGIRLTLPEGGYALRHPLFDDDESTPEDLDHSMFVCAGWRTIIFVPIRQRGQDASLAAVHMMRPDQRWDAHDPERRRVGIATEALLASYRQGRNAFSADLLQLARENKAADPMLGIFAAHSLLLANERDWRTFDDLVTHLAELIPRHPDVLALRAIGIDHRHRMHSTAPPPIDTTLTIDWPPILAASYQGVLQIDAWYPDVPMIAEKSTAERAAARFVAQETWCAWESLPEEPAALEDDANFRRLKSYVDERVQRATGTSAGELLEQLCSVPERARIGRAMGLPSKAVEHGLRAMLEATRRTTD